MAWDNIPSNPIPAISIPEATLAGLTLSNYYLIGRYGNLFSLGATDPAAMTWTQLRAAAVVGAVGKSTNASLGDGYYVNPNQSDSLVINVQCAGLTTMAGTIQLTE